MMEGAGLEVAGIMAITKAAALAYLMFNLYTPPCFAALGAMRAEINDRRWFWGGVGLQMGTGYLVAFLVYQTGSLITLGTVGAGFVPGLAICALFVGTVWYLISDSNKKLKLSGKKAI